MTKQRCTLVLAALLLATLPALAADHLVTPAEMQARLAARDAARQADLRALEVILARPEALRAAKDLGQEPRALGRGLRALSDAELSDLAARAEALGQDPVAGLSGDVNQLLIIFLIIAIVILVLQAVD